MGLCQRCSGCMPTVPHSQLFNIAQRNLLCLSLSLFGILKASSFLSPFFMLMVMSSCFTMLLISCHIKLFFVPVFHSLCWMLNAHGTRSTLPHLLCHLVLRHPQASA